MNDLIRFQRPFPQVRVNVEGLLATFFDSNRNVRTRLGYRKDLESFTRFLSYRTLIASVGHLLSLQQGEANALVISWKNHMINEGKAPSTINRRLSALRSMLKLGRMVGLTQLTLEVSFEQCDKHNIDTTGIDLDDLQRLFKMVGQDQTDKGKRDFAILHLLFDSALRRSEISLLDFHHLDLKRKALSIHGKGRSSRQWVTMPDQAIDALTRWVEVRGTAPGPLFRNFDPAQKSEPRLQDQGIYVLTKTWGALLGIEGLRPHKFRRTAITRALDITNGDVRAVQKYSRHSSVETVLIYDASRRDLAGDVSKLVASSIPTTK